MGCRNLWPPALRQRTWHQKPDQGLSRLGRLAKRGVSLTVFCNFEICIDLLTQFEISIRKKSESGGCSWSAWRVCLAVLGARLYSCVCVQLARTASHRHIYEPFSFRLNESWNETFHDFSKNGMLNLAWASKNSKFRSSLFYMKYFFTKTSRPAERSCWTKWVNGSRGQRSFEGFKQIRCKLVLGVFWSCYSGACTG